MPDQYRPEPWSGRALDEAWETSRVFIHIGPITMFFLYIDPGAGSMVIQGLLAVALAIPFFFRDKVGAVMRRFRRPESGNAEQDER